MELQYSLSTTINIFFVISSLLFISFVSLKIKSSFKKNNRSTARKLPPGPWKLPIIGNLHNVLGSLPHHTLRKLSRKHGPLMHLKLGEVSAIVISSPSVAKQIMKTHDLSFAQRPPLLSSKIAAYGDIDIGFAPYGEYWRQMRKLCVLEMLSNKRVQSFSFIREEEISKLVESIRFSYPVRINLTERIFKSVSSITCRAAFGKKSEDEAALISIIKEGSLLAGGFNLSDLFPSKDFLHVIGGTRTKFKKFHEKIDKVLQTIINERIEKRSVKEEHGKKSVPADQKECLVDALLGLGQNGSFHIPLTNEHIKAVMFDMFAGGTDTVSKTIEWAMAEMIKNPKVMEKAQAEIRQVLRGKKRLIHEADIQQLHYLKLVIKETLRLHPVAPLLLPRECIETCTIDGYRIPVKTKVIVSAWAMGRDPKYWDDPESFSPERFINSTIDYKGTNFEYIPFGAGRRMCPGMPFGIANVEQPLTQLLYHFNWKLPCGIKGENLDMTEEFGATVGRKTDLSLIAIPFTPVEDIMSSTNDHQIN